MLYDESAYYVSLLGDDNNYAYAGETGKFAKNRKSNIDS